MVAAVAAADCVVCNSSFLLHAAAAFRKPTVVLLGPSFDSASHHQRQWGYESISETLGPEPGARRGLASVEEALAAIDRATARRMERATG